jgi:hypothetical protein
MRFGRITGYMAGALSGLFGGLVGNQGGIRSAALMGFDINKEAFVATATAIGLVVDVFSHAGIRGGAVGRYLCAMEALVDRFGRSGRWYACGEASTEKHSRSRV